jgi:cystathionine beta-lyase
LVTVELDPRFTAAQADAFVDALRLFRIGWSWGGPVSLAVPYQAPSIRDRATSYKGTLVRFCLGLEAIADLIDDAEQALSALRA